MWAGVACGCCLSVGEFKNLVGNIFFVWRGVVTEFDYFKKFQVFDFLKSLALAKSCRKMRFGGKIFFKLWSSHQKVLKPAVPAKSCLTNYSRQISF